MLPLNISIEVHKKLCLLTPSLLSTFHQLKAFILPVTAGKIFAVLNLQLTRTTGGLQRKKFLRITRMWQVTADILPLDSQESWQERPSVSTDL